MTAAAERAVGMPDVELLRRVATHISETLYYASGALEKAHTRSSEKFVSHDDYDLLRDLAKRLEIQLLEARLEELR